MITRPVRERSVNEIVDAIEQSLANTGFEEIGLLSLSSSDYTHILDLVKALSDRFNENHLSVSLPSLRIESFSIDLMDALNIHDGADLHLHLKLQLNGCAKSSINQLVICSS